MATLQIEKDTALKLYIKATPTVKKAMEQLFGGEHFQANITDRVKTFEDACKVLKLKTSDVLFTTFPKGLKAEGKALQAQARLIIIARALNQGWVPDWNNSSQYKWYPWFNMGAGFGFSLSSCAYSDSHSSVGSRLYFRSEELANYAGKQFAALYKDLLTY